MAYDPNNLRVLGSNETGGPVIWSYQTRDPWADVVQPGYFRAHVGTVCLGDLIYVNADIERCFTVGTVSVLRVNTGSGEVEVLPTIGPLTLGASVCEAA